MSDVKRYHSAYAGSMYETKGSDFCEGADFVRASDYERLSASHARLEKVALAAYSLADAMETCHVCKSTILVSDEPIHCEDCSYDCDEHDGPECATLESLHRNLQTALYEARRVS